MIKKSYGFTLIEMIVVMVILGILALVAIPKYIDLTLEAKMGVTQAGLGHVRSVLVMEYAKSVVNGNPGFPAQLAAGNFIDGKTPMNKLTGKSGIATVASGPAGTAIDGANGFWYVQSTGQAGAYSDGSVDTSNW